MNASASNPNVRRSSTIVRPLMIAAIGVALIAAMGGCVQAESSRYRGTMSRSVAPDRTVSADVSAAFGLRDGGGSLVSLTSVTE